MSLITGQEFMRKTRYQEMGTSPQRQGLPQPPLELPYPVDAELIALPDHDLIEIPAVSLQKIIEGRRSVRQYAEKPLSLEELSYLLWLTQGIQSVSERPATARTVPSAGARHAFETYLLINAVKGLQPGLYRFIALEHALLPLALDPGLNEKITKACLDQSHVHNSAVTFMWVAVVERMAWRYQERGYRYMHLDAGHVCQNLYLAAESIDCGVCAIAAFDDDLLNAALELDGDNLFAIYAASLGKKRG
jgi:SagB-type dehydrogenase family enzyme